MSKRIKELIEQAEKYAYESFDGNIDRNTERFKTKFAELIIRECINTIEEKFTRHSVTRSVRNTDYNIGLSTAVEAIEEHFGVEE